MYSIFADACFCCFLKCMDFSNQLEIYYYGNNSSSYQGEMAQTFWDTGSGYSEENGVLCSLGHSAAMFEISALKEFLRRPYEVKKKRM